MQPIDISYLAGIIDGEGCISLGVRKHIYVTPTLQVTNTCRELIDWLHAELGGTIYERKDARPTRKDSWLWTIAGAQARDIIRAIRPYLKVKGQQADVILSLETIDRALIPRDGKTGRLMRLPPEYHAATATAITSIRALNQRGPSPHR